MKATTWYHPNHYRLGRLINARELSGHRDKFLKDKKFTIAVELEMFSSCGLKVETPNWSYAEQLVSLTFVSVQPTAFKAV